MANNYTSFSTAQLLSPRDVDLMKQVYAATKEVAEMVRAWHDDLPEDDAELEVSVKSLQELVAAKGEVHELIHDLWSLQPNYPDTMGSIPSLDIDDKTAEGGWRSVALYDEDGEGDPDVLELILTTFLSKAQDVECWCVTGAFTCSKPRPDQFSGFAFLVAKNKWAKENEPKAVVRWLGIEEWFTQQKRLLGVG